MGYLGFRNLLKPNDGDMQGKLNETSNGTRLSIGGRGDFVMQGPKELV